MNRHEFKAFRKQKGWSQKEMAEKLGYKNQSIISYKETGKAKIDKQDRLIIKGYKAGIYG